MPVRLFGQTVRLRPSRAYEVAYVTAEARSRRRLVAFRTTGLPLALIVLIGTAGLASPARAAMDTRADALWHGLRERFPYHLQRVALSDIGKDGARVLIIAEPPPTLPRASLRQALKSVFGAALQESDIETRRQPVGYDGWVEDIVATLHYPKGAEGAQRLRDNLAELARRMYGTSYKFGPIRVPLAKPAAPAAPPSLTVSAAELKSWLLDSAAPVVSLDFGTPHRLKDLLAASGRPGVYLSGSRGLVVLLLPRDQPINAYRGDIRKFTLDTDAIVGAIAVGDSRLALVGRERDTPLEAVPPLRVESILALAATKEAELGQSYERMAAFAGKLPAGSDRGKDWAPIYLSRDLVNTEFGSLLNITDQMLKSWSEAGRIEYVRFDYKKPASFPFEGGLLRHLGSAEVTYNWNTVGVGAVYAVGNDRIFALTRTGSLPVSYFPENGDQSAADTSKVGGAENRGYDYFSGLRDPYLGRVVQYTAVYQIFRAFKVKAVRDADVPENYGAATKVALSDARRALDAIADGKATPNEDFARLEAEAEAGSEGQPSADAKRRLYELIVAAGLATDVATAGETLRQWRQEFGSDVIDRIATILVDRSSLDKDALAKIGRIVAEAPNEAEMERRIGNLTPREQRALVDFLLLQSPDKLEALRAALAAVVDLEAVRTRFVRAAAAIESGYIKTPSIVLSWQGNMRLTGGHNLYSRTTSIEMSTSVPRGQVAIATAGDGRGKVVRINPDDAPRANELPRVFERHAGEANVKQLLEAELARGGTVREIKVALALSDTSSAEGRGLTLAREGNLAVGETGYRVEQPTSVDALRAIQADAQARDLDMVIARDADGYLVLRLQPKPNQTVRAASEPAMIETINGFAEQTAATRLPGGQPPLRIGTADGLAQGELWGIIRTQELRTAGGGRGGWKPPAGGRPVAGFGPERGQPEGYFFHVDRDGDTAVAYSSRRGTDDPIVLRVAAKDGARAEATLRKPVEWGKAKVKPLGPSTGVGPWVDEVQLAYEITIPLKPDGWGSYLWGKSVLVKVASFFKRAPSQSEIQEIDAAIARVKEASTQHDALAIDGLAALKAEILDKVRPAHLQFHLKYGTDDLFIVERGDAAVADDRFPG